MNMVDKFVDELKREGKSNNTISAYKTDINQFLKWLYDTVGADTTTITEIDVKQYVQYLNINKKQSTNTINRKVKSIVQYVKYLNNTDISNIMIDTKDVKQKSVDNTEVKVIDKHDLFKLKRTIYASNNKRDICIYEILINTGVRCSELINIELDDICLTERNGSNNYSYINIRNGKGNKNRRINLNSAVVKAIKDYLEVRPVTKDNKLLQGQRGALTRIAINKMLNSYCRDAKINTVTPHEFRHTCFSTMVKNGVDIKTIAGIAGHSSTDITYKYYVNSSSEDKQNAVDILNKIF
ncbi:tyrosine-type recombinase/integrase [Clostridium guangxiense]|uniref:tyrosine-type recombinase/integrase n=1 Tax=Clostridium guangxiense TaxID=1662055 RepID=UPI001E506A92|nr:tyrosine-type recombinase/integrase [Clostridium guangxiense]MCD2346232.1 tyrosine-type recombinase/integrase [Clostridium guangxiense]